jgi:hypothetical protein
MRTYCHHCGRNARPLDTDNCGQIHLVGDTHGQDLLNTGGEFSGLVSKRLNIWQKPSIQAFPEEGFMFSNPRGSCHSMSWQAIRESA